MNETELLVVDNFSWSISTDFEARTVTDLIRFRYDRKLPTILVSNLDVKQINFVQLGNAHLMSYFSQIIDFVMDSSRYTQIAFKNKDSLRGNKPKTKFDFETSLLNKLPPEQTNCVLSPRKEPVSHEVAYKASVLCHCLLDKTISRGDLTTNFINDYDRLHAEGKLNLSQEQQNNMRKSGLTKLFTSKDKK